MNKEEILAKSRRDYKNNDELMVDVLSKSSKRAGEVGLLITAIIVAGDQFFYNTYNYGAQAIYFGIVAAMVLVKYKYIKEKKNLVLGTILAIGTVLCLIAHFMSLN